MARYYKIQIGSLWLTSDGTETGTPCKITFPDAALLVNANIGTTRIASDGSPFSEFPLTAGKGRVFSLDILALETSIFDQLKTLLDGLAVTNPTALAFNATGVPGNISTHVLGNFAPQIYSFEDFRDTYVRNITLNLVTAADPSP